MQKPMLLALLFCRKKLLLKNLWQFTQSCFQNSFQLVFYTLLTLGHCSTFSSINNSPTPLKSHSLSMYLLWLLILSLPLYSMFNLFHTVHNALLQFCSKRCDIEPFPVTFILRILLMQLSKLHSCLLQKSNLTQLKITVQNNWLALA